MDTIVFGLIGLTALAVIRDRPRRDVLICFAVSLVAALLLFNHHVTSSLDFGF